MFPDSQIAQQFQCGPTKVMYLICYGLAPYFRDRLFSKLGPDTPYVVSFDESLNRIIQEEQMDLLVRFYDEERQMVVTRYLGSQFMGHTRAPDLLDKFMEGLEKLPAKNILQVSMDGPNVNKKFLESLTASRKSEHLPALLDIGSCPLHVVHGGFKFGAQKTGWQLDCLLRSMFYCFSDSPARREDYCKITGSEKFPLPFCATRWLEDAPVAERALELLPDVMKYVTETVRTKKKSQLPTASSFKTLQKFSEDKLLEAKLHFFVYVAKLTRKFLQVYQSDKPLVPFLAHDLESLIRSVLHKFVKHEVLSQAKTPSKVTTIDVYKKDNLLSYKEVELGFAADLALSKAEGISDLQMMQFRIECEQFYQGLAFKLIDRSPLKFPIVHQMVSIDPQYMVSRSDKAREKFVKVLSGFIDLGWYTAEQCDTILEEYKSLINMLKNHHYEECKRYNYEKTRLDEFFCGLLKNDQAKYDNVWTAVKKLLILSHGQSSIERGFSINKQTLGTHLSRDNLLSYRVVQDGLRDMGGKDVTVTSDMIAACRRARSRYQQHMDSKSKETNSERLKQKKRKQTSDDLVAEKEKRQRLDTTMNKLIAEADKLALEAEKQLIASKSTEKLVKSNAIRKRSREIKQEIVDCEKKHKMPWTRTGKICPLGNQYFCNVLTLNMLNYFKVS